MKILLRLLLFLTGSALIILDIGPFFISGEINIGLIAGVALGAVLILYALLFRRINSLIAKAFSHIPGRVILSAAALFLSAAVAVSGFTLANIVKYSKETDKRTEYIIVLGCMVNSTVPGRHLSARISRAYEYLTENPGSKAILSGGQGRGEDITEARCMFNELTARGISPDRLILEEKSTSTIENFENSRIILDAMGINIDEITVVTNDFHEYRASRFAARNNLKAYPYPAKTAWTGYLPFAFREIFAIGYQVYLGRNNLTN